ncbi:maker139 [Drosophila busckii]|uniref:Maker139 n=1 Tax=Drosophila busckii TaxID=30019 RepID=A0A0M3QVM9_DROBS|nr:uncharacterized protein LOC108594954 [Drosophila busckii]ALC42673.1 maker139 [Drosophila busckii]
MKSVWLGLFYLLLATAYTAALDDENDPVGDGKIIPIDASSFAFKDADFALGTSQVSWYQAELLCASIKFTLASILTAADITTVDEWLQKQSIYPLLTQPIWTSGSNLAYSPLYSWHGTGDFITLDNFSGKRPSGTKQMCIGLNARNNLWTAHSCSDKRYFLCQKRVC